MLDTVVDLRTDAITRPTEAMWAAMRDAPLGWALAGEDPSVQELERLAAELTGKEAAVFVPTGTMANLVALLSHTSPGDQIILESSSHILWSEEWSFASIGGVVARPIPGVRGFMEPAAIRLAIEDQRSSHRPRTSLVCVENTHNAAGGAVLSQDQLAVIADVAHTCGIPVHLDGARVFNAAVALGVDTCDLVAEMDSLALNLNKGLSAPEGALLCGSHDFIQRSRYNLRRLGGHSLHKAGIFAAAGLVALREMIPQLAQDHRRAQLLARELADVPGLHVTPAQTNIVMITLETGVMSAQSLIQQLERRYIRAFQYAEQTVRFVTHRNVTDADVMRAAKETREIIVAQPRVA